MLTEQLDVPFGGKEDVSPDAILAANRRAQLDPNALNLSIGYFFRDSGKRFMPEVVKQVWPEVDPEGPYLGPTGDTELLGDENYLTGTARLLFGEDSEVVREKRFAGAGTPGGTGALHLAARAISLWQPERMVLMGDPAWANHKPIFENEGLMVGHYNHAKDGRFDLDAAMGAISESPRNTVVLFQAGGHNPTGIDPTEADWQELAGAMEGRTALFDAAYLGLVHGMTKDTKVFQPFLENGVQMGVAVSNSKNMGLYKWRVGAIISPQQSVDHAIKQNRMFNVAARSTWSTPPAGQEAPGLIYASPDSTQRFLEEINNIPQLLRERRVLVAQLSPLLGHFADHNGMYDMLYLPKSAIDRLPKDESVYPTGEGRVNVGALFTQKVEVFTGAVDRIAQTL